MSGIQVCSLTLPPVNRSEVLRYAGIRQGGEEFAPLIDRCADEVADRLAHEVVFGEFPLYIGDDCIDLGFARVRSHDLAKNLSGCSSVVVFGATVGLVLDRMIAKYGVISPTKALFFQSLGAERIEALCDAFCTRLREERSDRCLRPRFSPGYGDCPLAIQRTLIEVLDGPKTVGLTCNESLLLSPTKSVTAFVGVEHGHGAVK